jgi:hypothetical protein
LLALSAARFEQASETLVGGGKDRGVQVLFRVGAQRMLAFDQDALQPKDAVKAWRLGLEAMRQGIERQQHGLERLLIDDEFGSRAIALDIERERYRATRNSLADAPPQFAFDGVEPGRQSQPDIEATGVDRFDLAAKGRVFSAAAGTGIAGHADKRLTHELRSSIVAGIITGQPKRDSA